jgi:hypothetical protein
MIVVDELGHKSSMVISGLISGAAGLVTGGWGRVAMGVLAGATKAYAAETKDVTEKALAEGGRKFISQSVVIGERVSRNRQRTAPSYVAGASFWGEGERHEWIWIKRDPRASLLGYRPGEDISEVPQLIDRVSVGSSWDDMLQAAGSDSVDWSRPVDVKRFCGIFRRELQKSLQQDVWSVRLGLYAQFWFNRDLYRGERGSIGCLEPAELKALRNAGYVPNFIF